MCRVAVLFSNLFVVYCICCHVCIHGVSLLCGLCNVVCNPQIVVTGGKNLAASDTECAVGTNRYSLTELLTVLLAPWCLVLGVNEQLACVGSKVCLYVCHVVPVASTKSTLYTLECYVALKSAHLYC